MKKNNFHIFVLAFCLSMPALFFLACSPGKTNDYTRLQDFLNQNGYDDIRVDADRPFEEELEEAVTSVRKSSNYSNDDDAIRMIVEFQAADYIAKSLRATAEHGTSYQQRIYAEKLLFALIEVASRNTDRNTDSNTDSDTDSNTDISDCVAALQELCQSKNSRLDAIAAMLYIHETNPEHFDMYKFNNYEFFHENIYILAEASEEIKEALLQTPYDRMVDKLFINKDSIDRNSFHPSSPIDGCYIYSESHDEYPDALVSRTNHWDNGHKSFNGAELYPAKYLDNVSIYIDEHFSYGYIGRYYNQRGGAVEVYGESSTVSVTNALNGKILFQKSYEYKKEPQYQTAPGISVYVDRSKRNIVIIAEDIIKALGLK